MPLDPVTSIRITKATPELKKLDQNGDGVINRKDFPRLNDEEFKAAMMVASSMKQRFVEQAPDSFELAGKRVLFSGLTSMTKAEARSLAEDSGAEVKNGLSRKVDVVVVGDTDKTTKDEKAIRMTASGRASIMLMTEAAFRDLTSQGLAGVVQVGDYGAPYTTLETEVYNSDTGDYETQHGQISDALLSHAMAAARAEAQIYFENALDDPTPQNVQEAVDSLDISSYKLNVDRNEIVLTARPDYPCGFECHYDLSSGELDYVEGRD